MPGHMIMIDFAHSQQTYRLIQCLPIVTKCYSTMMRIMLFNKNITIEAHHFRNGEHTDCAKGTSIYG